MTAAIISPRLHKYYRLVATDFSGAYLPLS